MSATTRSTMIGVSLVPGLLEQLGQRGLAEVLVVHRLGGSRSACDDVLGELEQLLEELDADAAGPARGARLRSSSRSPSALNCGSCPRACAGGAASLISISLAFLSGSGVAEHRLEQLGVQDQRLEVVADRVDVDVLVDQLDRLRRRARARAACPCRSAASPTRRPASASGSRSRTARGPGRARAPPRGGRGR